MADDATPIAHPADEKRQPRPAGIYEHYCEHLGCTLWGGFGFTRGKAEPNWFCSEHAPLGKPARSDENDA